MSAEAFGTWSGLGPLYAAPDEETELARARWNAALDARLYGPLPAPPDSMEIERQSCGAFGPDRLVLTMRSGPRRFDVDALLWRPPGLTGPVPVVAGLDFLGPVGLLPDRSFPVDDAARLCARPELGGERARMIDEMRGATGYRWPVPLIHERGCALLLSCYGSWVPDDPQHWRERGLVPLLEPAGVGAVSLWAWAMGRLLDVAATLPGLDGARVFLAGHSRLGKAALRAAAHDRRAAAVWANASGCAGAAPAAHDVGESLGHLTAAYPHWLRPGARSGDGLDQHMALAAVAPTPLFLSAARDDLWADPVGSYTALTLASGAWGQHAEAWPEPDSMWREGGVIGRGRLGHSLRAGGHDMLPHDWQGFLGFLGGLGLIGEAAGTDA